MNLFVPKPLTTLAHFSDIHLEVPWLGFRLANYFSKNLIGKVNLHLFGRAKHFQYAERIVKALMLDLQQNPVDQLIFSGDATAIGTVEETQRSAELLQLGAFGMPPGIAVPGNHDLYTRSALRKQTFETAFAPWLQGVRVDDAVYPFAQKIHDIWLIAVNSSRPNLNPIDSRGEVGQEQLDRLVRLLKTLSPGLKILVTHYPIHLANGKPESLGRRIRDWKQINAVAREYGIHLWLHGHRHRSYHLCANENQSFLSIGSGSLTQISLWSYNQYHLSPSSLKIEKRRFDLSAGVFQTDRVIEFTRSPDDNFTPFPALS